MKSFLLYLFITLAPCLALEENSLVMRAIQARQEKNWIAFLRDVDRSQLRSDLDGEVSRTELDAFLACGLRAPFTGMRLLYVLGIGALGVELISHSFVDEPAAINYSQVAYAALFMSVVGLIGSMGDRICQERVASYRELKDLRKDIDRYVFEED